MDKRQLKCATELKITIINNRSLINLERRNAFCNAVNKCGANLYAITETWRNEEFPDSELGISNLCLYRKERSNQSSKHWGVMLAVRSDLKHSPIFLSMHLEDVIACRVEAVESYSILCAFNASEESIYRWSFIHSFIHSFMGLF